MPSSLFSSNSSWKSLAASAEDAAELYIANTIGTSRYYCMKEGEEYPLRNCPNCGVALSERSVDFRSTTATVGNV